jgi:hypothetical protein
MSELPDEAFHALSEEETIYLSLHVASPLRGNFMQKALYISDMVPNLPRGEIIQTIYVLKGGLRAGKEIEFIAEALLGKMSANVAEVIAGYEVKRPFHVISNAKSQCQNPVLISNVKIQMPNKPPND